MKHYTLPILVCWIVVHGFAQSSSSYNFPQWDSDSLNARYEYPEQTLEYNGRDIKLNAEIVYKRDADNHYKHSILTLRLQPVGATGFSVAITTLSQNTHVIIL